MRARAIPARGIFRAHSMYRAGRRIISGMKPGECAIAAAMVFFAATGCSRHGDSKDLAALDSAYKAGVLSKDEYTARKAAILSLSTQLAALDRARQAGLLTADEYAAKKAALFSSAPPPAPTITAVADAPYVAPTSQPVSQPSAAIPQVSPTPAADPQGHSYRMKMAQIVDAQGFERPIPSASLLIPIDWQSQSATTWIAKDRCNGVSTHVLVSGPDGRAFERFPVYNWVWADDPKPLQAAFAQRAQMGTHVCDVMPPMGAQEYLRRNMAKLRPNAQLVGFEPAPKLMQDLQTQAQQTEAAARQYNLKQQVKFDAIKARVKYSLDGKPMEEWILAATVATGTFGAMQQWSYNCVAYSAGQRAPAGTLDGSMKLFELIASTFRVNPEWQARINKNALAMQQIQQKGIRDRAAIVAKSAEDQRNIQRQGYENQQKVQDSTSTGFSQYIRGVETYQNPATGEKVDLDSNYGHAWVNNQGVYLLSDQASFDPNSVAGNTANWTALQQVKK
jgi:hypothetical protein